MSTDLLRVQANERVDFDDFTFFGQRSLEDNVRHVLTHFLCRPGAQQAWILSGFALSNPSGNLLQVDRGVAVLPRREGTLIVEGLLTSEGDAQKTVDLSGYVAATHGIYLQFTYQEGEIESRLFWNPSTEEEYAQSVPTRLQAAWNVRVERVNPGSEWFKIGEINPSTMIITDQRDFYFEGKVDTSYAANRWGSGSDRNSDRAQYGISDFQRFTEAMRTTLEELKSSSGSRRWWEAGVRDLVLDTGPLRVGFSGGISPANKALMVGDIYYHMAVIGTTPTLNFDSGDKLEFDRASNTWQWFLGATPLFQFGPSTGLWVYDSNFSLWVYGVSPRVTFDTTDWLTYNRTNNAWEWVVGGGVVATQVSAGFSVAGGLQVGFAGTPIADTLEIGDNLTWLSNVGAIGLRVQFDGNDYLDFLRGSPEIVRLVLDGATQWESQPGTGTTFPFGVRVGAAGVPVAGKFEVGDANNNFALSSSNPLWTADTNDTLKYNRTANTWEWTIGSSDVRAELKEVSSRGSFGLRDSVGTVRHLDGNDYQALKGLANAGLVQSSFLLRGGNLWYSSAAPNNVAAINGIAYINGKLVVTENTSFQIDTNSRWLAGAFPWTYHVTVAEAWVFAFVNDEGNVRLSLYQPNSGGYLSTLETVEGGKTLYDYCFIGSFYYVNEDGSAHSGIMPFARQGDTVWFQPNEQFFYQRTDVTAGFLAINKTAPQKAFPSGADYPYSTATGLIYKVKQELDPLSGSDFDTEVQFAHGTLDYDGPLPTVMKTVEYKHRVHSLTAVEWFDGPFTLMLTRTGGANFTLGGMYRNAIADGPRTITLYVLGYIEPLNGIRHVATGL